MEPDMTDKKASANTPEDVAPLMADCVNSGDAEGAAALYEEDAVLAFPPGHTTVGRKAIQRAYEQLIAKKVKFPHEKTIPIVVSGDLALAGSQSEDGKGARTQVLRRQADGSWLRVIDRPEA
jgi:uncharacterized protein (TIGR02246 family)